MQDFLQAGCRSCHPANGVKALEGQRDDWWCPEVTSHCDDSSREGGRKFAVDVGRPVLGQQLVLGDQLAHVTGHRPLGHGQVRRQFGQRYQRLTDRLAGAEETATAHPQRCLQHQKQMQTRQVIIVASQ